MLTDNEAIFNARAGKGRTDFESELDRLGIVCMLSRPYCHQTWGKTVRFHQTTKKYLVKRSPVRTWAGDQRFRRALQTACPYRASGNLTPLEEAFCCPGRRNMTTSSPSLRHLAENRKA